MIISDEKPIWYHGNLSPDFEIGDWLHPWDEGEGGYDYVYYTPDINLAMQYTESDTARMKGKFGRVYVIEPVNGREDEDHAVHNPGLVYICDRALIVGIAY